MVCGESKNSSARQKKISFAQQIHAAVRCKLSGCESTSERVHLRVCVCVLWCLYSCVCAGRRELLCTCLHISKCVCADERKHLLLVLWDFFPSCYSPPLCLWTGDNERRWEGSSTSATPFITRVKQLDQLLGTSGKNLHLIPLPPSFPVCLSHNFYIYFHHTVVPRLINDSRSKHICQSWLHVVILHMLLRFED